MKKIDLKDRKNEYLWDSSKKNEQYSLNASDRSEQAENFEFFTLKERKNEKFWDYPTKKQ